MDVEDREPDYYAALGLKPDASAGEIHHAFRRLAKLWHPDRYTSAPAELRASAERRMRTLTRAYSVLSDDIERHAYDRRHGLLGARVAPPSELWVAHTHTHTHTQSGKIRPIGEQNANGVGLFAGLLCSILAFALLGRLLTGGLNGWEGALVTLLLLGLLILAGLFFTNETPMAEKAREWAEGEPAGMHEPKWHEPRHMHEEEGEDDGLAEFNTLVDEALAGIPDDFKSWLENVVVRVEANPSEETLRQAHVGHGHTLLGLYAGVPLTVMGTDRAGPEIVTIFRRPIERYCHGDRDRIREQVRATVLHEIAHHFGIDHDEMPHWVK
ncbi:MAG TPA: metallopeptidase family protein [Ktedonobacterales bacterium]|jgi:predicted Zn-dependent protease with MMP-like domain|nr:metallopeptidase family protein [Ktedonobacterales bacterium]